MMRKNKELTNKKILFLLLTAIVISVGGTFISLNRLNNFTMSSITGAITGEGKADYTIGTTTSIAVWRNIDFGSGYSNTSAAILEGNSSDGLSLDGTGTWSWGTRGQQYILVVNDGNVNVSLNVSANNSASTFIGGTNPVYNISIVYEENSGAAGPLAIGACFANTTVGATDLRKFSIVSNSVNTTLCTNFSFFDADDAINVTVRLVVPNDAPTELKSSLLTFHAVAK